ncbi:hypothetical protein ACFL6G_05070 [candidate division KSB1 bacterium]
MADMPTRQKILLIFLAIVVAYYLFTMIGSSDETTTQTPQPISAPGGQAQRPVNNLQGATGTPAMQRQTTAAGMTAANAMGTPAQSQAQEMPEVALDWKSDPFFRAKEVIAVSETPESELLKGLSFGGSSMTSKMKVVFINNKLYKLNDTIDGFKIIEIHSDHAVLADKNNKRYTLR